MYSNLFFIINSLEGGGAEKVFSKLVNNIEQRDGFKSTIIILDDLPSVYSVQGDVVFLSKNKLYSAFLLFFLFLKKRPVVSVSFLPRSNVLNIIFSKIFSCRCIISERSNTVFRFRGKFSRLKRWLTTYLYNKAKVVVSCSKGVNDCLVNNVGVHSPIMKVIYNPYDIDNLLNTRVIPEGIPYFCAVGRLVPSKRFDTLIRAIVGTKYCIKVLGDGPLREELNSMAKHFGVSERIEFLGFKNSPHEIIKGSRGFILTSECEGFPNALVESMILSVPCIASNCKDGPSELFEFDGKVNNEEFLVTKYGLVFNVGDEVGLRKCMDYLSSNDVELKEIARNSSEKCKRYNLEYFVNSFECVIYEKT